jgi:hypothetical protein
MTEAAGAAAGAGRLSIHQFPAVAGHAVPALAQELLARARAAGASRIALLEIGEPADLVGRFQRVGAGALADRLPIARRLTGGCALRVGAGAIVALLALPRSVELRPTGWWPLPLAKVLNRCVRPFMGALNRLGARVFYPGRDRLSHERRTVAILGFHAEPDGAIVFELIIAAAPNSLSLAAAADRLELVGESSRALCADLGWTGLRLSDYATAVGKEYSERMGWSVELQSDPWPARPLPPTAVLVEDEAWVQGQGWGEGQLGELWAGIQIRSGRLARAAVRGAFLGLPEALQRLERALVGSTLTLQELRAVLAPALRPGPAALFGLGDGRGLVDALAGAGRAISAAQD